MELRPIILLRYIRAVELKGVGAKISTIGLSPSTRLLACVTLSNSVMTEFTHALFWPVSKSSCLKWAITTVFPEQRTTAVHPKHSTVVKTPLISELRGKSFSEAPAATLLDNGALFQRFHTNASRPLSLTRSLRLRFNTGLERRSESRGIPTW
jgi:hypothetical protein